MYRYPYECDSAEFRQKLDLFIYDDQLKQGFYKDVKNKYKFTYYVMYKVLESEIYFVDKIEFFQKEKLYFDSINMSKWN